MKKIVYFLLILLVTSCQSNLNYENTITGEEYQNYRSYYNITLSATAYQSSSTYFDLSAQLTAMDEGFRYDIFIDNPRVEMRNILVMVVENNTIYEVQKDMMPNVGILGSTVHMLPYQVQLTQGYVKGINLNRVISNSAINLKIYVQFDTLESNQSIRQFFNLDVSL